MAILPIYLYGSEVLRAKAEPVTRITPEVIKLVYDMFETMHAASGIGLAATQVGALMRIIVVDISGIESDEDGAKADDAGDDRTRRRTSPGLPTVLSLINPEIVSTESDWVMEEGCLSIPDVRAEVERAEKVRMRYRDTKFQEQEIVADGLLARVLLHELDHLDGILFIDHISKTERGLMSTRLRRIKKGVIETSYPVVTMENERSNA